MTGEFIYDSLPILTTTKNYIKININYPKKGMKKNNYNFFLQAQLPLYSQ